MPRIIHAVELVPLHWYTDQILHIPIWPTKPLLNTPCCASFLWSLFLGERSNISKCQLAGYNLWYFLAFLPEVVIEGNSEISSTGALEIIFTFLLSSLLSWILIWNTLVHLRFSPLQKLEMYCNRKLQHWWGCNFPETRLRSLLHI